MTRQKGVGQVFKTAIPSTKKRRRKEETHFGFKAYSYTPYLAGLYNIFCVHAGNSAFS
jgi:hypothetical protein